MVLLCMQAYHVTRQVRNWVRLALVVLIMVLVLVLTAGKYVTDNNLAKATTTKREENVNLLSASQVGATLAAGALPICLPHHIACALH